MLMMGNFIIENMKSAYPKEALRLNSRKSSRKLGAKPQSSEQENKLERLQRDFYWAFCALNCWSTLR
jgi:hypothetical protein